MEHTKNYQLSQWEAEDKVLRTDFNTDNAKIDAAIKAVDQKADGIAQSKADRTALEALEARAESISRAGLKIVRGSYVGRGGYGESGRRTLNFPEIGRPLKLFVLQPGASNAMVIVGGAHGFGDGCAVSWTDYGISWYGDFGYNSYDDEGVTYRYVAIG